MGKNIKGFKSFNEEIYLKENHDNPHDENIENDSWWIKNNQRLIYYTGNPTAIITLKKEHPDKASEWEELDEIGKAKLLFTTYTIEEIEEQLKEFEDIDD